MMSPRLPKPSFCFPVDVGDRKTPQENVDALTKDTAVNNNLLICHWLSTFMFPVNSRDTVAEQTTSLEGEQNFDPLQCFTLIHKCALFPSVTKYFK